MLALFGIWQMGIIFFSTDTLSLNGMTPLPVRLERVTAIILLGYLLSILTLLFFQKKHVYIARAALIAALAGVLGLLLPLEAEILAGLIYLQIFLCVYLIGMVMATAILAISLPQVLLYDLLTGIFTGICVPLLQNDSFSVPYSVFAAVFLLLWKKAGFHPLRMTTVYIILCATGFLLYIAAEFFAPLRLPAALLTGSGIIACMLSDFFAASLFLRHPSRFVAPAVVIIAVLTVLLHTLLLDALRNNAALLTIVCSLLVVIGTFVYQRIEPHLTYAWAQDTGPQVSALEAQAAYPPVFSVLTPQERVVADLILRGYTTKEICAKMYITVNTQKDYRKKIYSKLDIHSRRELFEITAGKPADGK